MPIFNDSSFVLEFDNCQINGARYFVPGYARHRPAARTILAGRYFEPDTHRLMAELLAVMPGNIVHAGTFFGDMLPSFSSACGATGRVYAFEPLLENYVLARLTVDANRLDNVVLFNAGLGASIGSCRMVRNRAGQHAGGASKVSADGEVTATLVTVDSLSLPQLSVLQLDVEGFEAEALAGAQATLATHSPVVMVEDNDGTCAAILKPLGYQEVGRIPGLILWCPAGKPDMAERLRTFKAVKS